MIVSRLASDAPLPAPDIYFSASYAPACEAETSGKWLSLSNHDGTWQLPVVLSPIPGEPGKFDAASPYGYSGVYAAPNLSVPQQRQLWHESVEVLRSAGVVSLFLRHSGLVSTMDPTLAGDHQTIVSGHPTVAVDITTTDAMWEALQGRTRTAVRKANKNGLDVRVRPFTSADCAKDSPFRILYESTMARVGAAQKYIFPHHYYAALFEGLGRNLLITEVYDSQNSVCAAGLLMQSDTLLHYHLSGSNPDQARLGANNLMLWGAMDWAARNDITRFHLGGGVSADDPLLRFKKSFGGRDLEFFATGHIIDPARYATLVSQTSPDENDPSETFFPAYRRSPS